MAEASFALLVVASVAYESDPESLISRKMPTMKIRTAPTSSRRLGPVRPSQNPVTFPRAPI